MTFESHHFIIHVHVTHVTDSKVDQQQATMFDANLP